MNGMLSAALYVLDLVVAIKVPIAYAWVHVDSEVLHCTGLVYSTLLVHYLYVSTT